MQALVYSGSGPPQFVHDQPREEPGAGWARIRMLRAGICGTDLELLQGYKDFSGVPGHEFIGIVDSCPNDPALEGRRIVGEINVACGKCAPCRRGDRSHCDRRRVLGIIDLPGAFADYLLLPIENLHLVPDAVSDEEATFVEPLAAALEILEQVHVRPSNRVYVLGAGRIGLLIGQVIALTGCEVTMVGHHPDHLALAEGWGLQTQLVQHDERPDLAPADVVIECTGRAQGLHDAVRLVRPRGTVVVKSTFHGTGEWRSNDVVVNELTLVGSRCGPFPPALRLLERGLVQVRPLIAAVYPLTEALAALDHAARPGVLKIQLTGDG